MSAKWSQIEEVFHAALEIPSEKRNAFLDDTCAGDAELWKEVETLLTAHEKSGRRFEDSAADVAAAMFVAEESSASLIGRKFERYKILSKLGEGGMGEVYLAQDTTLNRKIALKILPPQFTKDPDRVRRFEQEVRTASALNHPNIITIHEVGQFEDTHFIATELIEGATLRERMPAQPMRLPEILDIGMQVSAALAAAHTAGIIHRDIKPANIMIRNDGYAKVLDFGLAKLMDQKSQADMTDPGRVMGTVSYMSPEQALGEKLDHRTDIFSLGVVLYEIATGTRPFDGKSDAAIYDAILNKAPAPATRANPILPLELDHIIRRALEKDRDLRYQTASDLRADLKRLERDSRSGAAVTAHRQEATPRTNRKTLLVAGGAGIVAVLATLFWIQNTREPNEQSRSFTPAGFTRLTDWRGPEQFPTLSPDGKSFAYASAASGNWDIYLQRVGGKNAINLTKDSPADDTQPAFSPDGEYVAFRCERDGGGIFITGSTGENVRRATDFGYNPVWSPDGKEIVCATEGIASPRVRFTMVSQLWAINVQSGEKRLVTEEDAVQPNWSPHGKRIAYWGIPKGNRDIYTVAAEGGQPVAVTNDAAVDWNPVWSPDGNYLYFVSDREGSMNVWRVRIDETTGKTLGVPEPVTIPAGYVGHLSFSRDARRMLYVQSDSKNNLQQIGFDPDTRSVVGQPVKITQGSLQTTDPGISPDGESIAFSTSGETQEDIYVSRNDGTSLRQLTNDPDKDRLPRWSPDSRQIAFQSNRGGRWGIWTINPDGSGLRQITPSSDTAVYPSWSPDGTRLAYSGLSSAAHIIPFEKSSLQTPVNLPPLQQAQTWLEVWSWSPDGQTLAGWEQNIRHSGGILLYSLGPKKFEKISDRGLFPIWLNDSSNLLFYDLGKLYLIDRSSKTARQILSVAPYEIDRFDLSRDNRMIYYSLATTESDIWLMTFK
jgi:eukaryotic-like serine/threonine-protein kinase